MRERVALPPQARVLGALWFERRALFVERTQSPARRRFTEAHEIGHLLCPWHRAVVRLDTAGELFGQLGVGIEAEANLAASELIFQGSRFTAEAAEHERSLRTPLALADALRGLRARRRAPLRRAPRRAAGPARRRPLARRAWAACPSGAASSRPPSPPRSGRSPAASGTSAGAARAWPRRSRPPAARRSRCRRRSPSAARTFPAEVLNNRHCHLILVTGRRRAPGGASPRDRGAPGRWPSPPGRGRRTGQQPAGRILTTTCRSPVRRSASGRPRSSHSERGCGSGHRRATSRCAAAQACAADRRRGARGGRDRHRPLSSPPRSTTPSSGPTRASAPPRTRAARPPRGGRPSPSVRLRSPSPPCARRPAAAPTSGSPRAARSWPRWRSGSRPTPRPAPPRASSAARAGRPLRAGARAPRRPQTDLAVRRGVFVCDTTIRAIASTETNEGGALTYPFRAVIDFATYRGDVVQDEPGAGRADRARPAGVVELPRARGCRERQLR